MAPQTYLVTGANKGVVVPRSFVDCLGKCLITTFLSRPQSTVIATVRDPNHATSKSLLELPKGDDSKLVIVKIASESETDSQDAVRILQTEHGIQNFDVVVANAGWGTIWDSTLQTKPQEVRDMVNINAIGPLLLWQATHKLLEASTNPRFVLIGSPQGSIAGMEKKPLPMVAYGGSKTIAHFFTRRIHLEFSKVTAFVIDPGFMKTDTGNTGARHFGLAEAFVDPNDSAAFAVKQIDNATKESTSGKFLTVDANEEGGVFEW
ncbi:MAG: hypothetical protein MMC23_008699 [Stictis urceolatum]|nr:hypothetical protein [Stictis urceolata]